jgi:hypothetical protein
VLSDGPKRLRDFLLSAGSELLRPDDGLVLSIRSDLLRSFMLPGRLDLLQSRDGILLPAKHVLRRERHLRPLLSDGTEMLHSRGRALLLS